MRDRSNCRSLTVRFPCEVVEVGTRRGGGGGGRRGSASTLQVAQRGHLTLRRVQGPLPGLAAPQLHRLSPLDRRRRGRRGRGRRWRRGRGRGRLVLFAARRARSAAAVARSGADRASTALGKGCHRLPAPRTYGHGRIDRAVRAYATGVGM